jgi:hypothetical protein
VQGIDRFEKLARLVLWLVLCGSLIVAFGVVPLQLVRQRTVESELRDQLKSAEAKILESAAVKLEPVIARLALSSMGPLMRGLNHSKASGALWFTNVSPRRGVVCAQGVVTNKQTGKLANSLAACKVIGPYDSNVELDFDFAGAELSEICPEAGGCSFEVVDVADSQPTPAPKTP